ncbi:hypothetical protein PTKIN_Ptkin08bG0045900 [Pterospermum kingtungense]
MTTLQRSSVSFRRQGSSGRIWSDRNIIDPKTGLPNAPTAAAAAARASKRSPELLFYLPQEEIHHPQPTNFQAHPTEPEGNVPKNPTARRKHGSAQKVPRCGISSLFGRCMGPTA